MNQYTLDEMKKVLGDDYAFHQTKTAEEVKRILETGEMPDGDNDSVPFVLEIGNLDIEITLNHGMGVISDNGMETEPLSIGYFCCVRRDGEWDSYDDVPYAVDLDVPDLESEMFKVLVQFAEERNLSFFVSNDHINQCEQSPEAEDEMER